MVVGGNISANG